jgi:hypothetical protein
LNLYFIEYLKYIQHIKYINIYIYIFNINRYLTFAHMFICGTDRWMMKNMETKVPPDLELGQLQHQIQCISDEEPHPAIESGSSHARVGACKNEFLTCF